MRHILINCDDKFFFKMKADKIKREKGKSISWEEYIKILFGFRK